MENEKEKKLSTPNPFLSNWALLRWNSCFCCLAHLKWLLIFGKRLLDLCGCRGKVSLLRQLLFNTSEFTSDATYSWTAGGAVAKQFISRLSGKTTKKKTRILVDLSAPVITGPVLLEQFYVKILLIPCVYLKCEHLTSMRLAAWESAGGRGDGDGAVCFPLSSETHLMRDDPCTAAGVCDGSLVCCLPGRYAAEGNNVARIFLYRQCKCQNNDTGVHVFSRTV